MIGRILQSIIYIALLIFIILCIAGVISLPLIKILGIIIVTLIFIEETGYIWRTYDNGKKSNNKKKDM